MSILTKTSRRRTSFEEYFCLQEKTSKSNQLQSHCCKQVPSSDKRVRCTECPMKGIITNTLSYKETGRLLANITITAYPYKSISANVEVSLPFHTKGFLLAERKRCLASIVLTKHPFLSHRQERHHASLRFPYHCAISRQCPLHSLQPRNPRCVLCRVSAVCNCNR